MKPTEGILTAMVTPFTASGDLDLPAVRRLASHLIDNGSHGIVVCGTTGESPTLSDAEDVTLVEAVRDEVGDRATVICGTGTNDTRHSVALTAAARQAGADACLVTTPYYNKPTQDGLRLHYRAIAEVGLPVILYNIPSRVVINLDPDFLAELAQIDGVDAVKQANNEQLAAIDGLDLLAGNDDGLLDCLLAGGTGGICVASHLVGPQMRELWEAARAGDEQRARDIDNDLREIYDVMGILTNPIPVKAALALQGHCEPTMRLPMHPPGDEAREVLAQTLRRHGLLGDRTAA
ncbi:MAG: 4-hydroxy-tetrahydrodipicolinate synthase [Solirubrobacterales bacterium]